LLSSDDGALDSITDLLALILTLTGFLLYIGSFTSSSWTELRTNKAEMEVENAMDVALNLKKYVLSEGDGVISLDKLSTYSANPSEIPVNATYLYIMIEWENNSAVLEKGTKNEGFIEIKMPVMVKIDELHSETGIMTLRVIP